MYGEKRLQHQPEDPTYCSTFDCGLGYALIEGASEEKCEENGCDKSHCCEKACSGYDCPKRFVHVDDAEKVVCKSGKCKRKQCCRKGGETYAVYICRCWTFWNDTLHFSCVEQQV